ncbi:MAG: FliA/WhiG family RNA polymerase sigma factor [Planctomycetota bacterium]
MKREVVPNQVRPDLESLWDLFLQTRSLDARNELVERYLPLVRSTAERIASRLPASIESDDLYSAGIFGLLDALRNFDPRKGLSFARYCRIRVRGAILDALRQQDWVPRIVRAHRSRLRESRRRLRAELNREPTPDELAIDMGVSAEDIAELLSDEPTTPVSLDSRVADEEFPHASERRDLLEDTRLVSPDERIQQEDVLRLAYSFLDEIEREIIERYYFDNLTMRQIGTRLSISESRVCQLHARILQKLARHFQRRSIEI